MMTITKIIIYTALTAFLGFGLYLGLSKDKESKSKN